MAVRRQLAGVSSLLTKNHADFQETELTLDSKRPHPLDHLPVLSATLLLHTFF